MKKRGIILIIMSMFLLLVGCSSSDYESGQSKYDDCMSKANSNISEEHYDEAKVNLEAALEVAPEDEEATKLIKKLDVLVSISKTPEDAFSAILQIEESEEAKEIATKSSAVDEKIDKRVLELTDIVLIEVNKYVDIEDYEAAKKVLQEILDKCKECEEGLGEIIEKCEQAIERYDTLIKEQNATM